VALERAVKKALVIGKMLVDMKIVSDEELDIVVHEDNKGAVDTLENRYGTVGVRHIRIKLAWIRELVDDGIIQLKRTKTNEQTADILTKLLSGPAGFYKHSGEINPCLKEKWLQLGIIK
jgi:hypothetical protein